jgi:hypothetical protein
MSTLRQKLERAGAAVLAGLAHVGPAWGAAFSAEAYSYHLRRDRPSRGHSNDPGALTEPRR